MIKFRMARISVGQFAILTDTMPQGDLSYAVHVGFKVASNAMRIACEFGVTFESSGDNDNGEKILLLEETCEFDIHPDSWNGLIKDNKMTVVPSDLCLLANQTVGVARGILYCKTENTPFTQFILPPINLTTLIKENLVVDLKSAVAE